MPLCKSLTYLLAQAETGKKMIQHLLSYTFTCNFAQVRQGRPQINGCYLRADVGIEAMQSALRSLERP